MNKEEMRKKRKALGLTQKELAELAGVSFQTINGYENGKEIPSTKHQILDRILNPNIASEPSEIYTTNKPGYDIRIKEIMEEISERQKSIQIISDEITVNHYKKIIKLLEERIEFIKTAKKEDTFE